MGKTTAETIKHITREHLTKGNGLLLAQCVSAVGWIGGTVPDCEGVIEIPMSDVAAPAFAVGCALKGRRPIFVVRYQGFMWYNASSFVNYAAKTKQVWGQSAPVFIRSLGNEGSGVGHTASSSIHSIFMHSPGLPVAAPMTPKEYQTVWDYFINHDDPVYVSEHRRSFQLTEEMLDVNVEDADVTVFAISAGRLNFLDAEELLEREGIRCNVFHLLWLKPFKPTKAMIESLKSTKVGIVIDSDYEITGASRSIAYELMHLSGVSVHALGLEDRVCGVAQYLENITPSPQKIADTIQNILVESQRNKLLS